MQPGPQRVGGPRAKLPLEGSVIVRPHYLALHWGARFGSQFFTRTIMIGAVGVLFFSVTTIFIAYSLRCVCPTPYRESVGRCSAMLLSLAFCYATLTHDVTRLASAETLEKFSRVKLARVTLRLARC